MDTMLLTAEIDLVYKLYEKPFRTKDGKWDGFQVKAGDAIRILKTTTTYFHALDAHTGKRTKAYSLNAV